MVHIQFHWDSVQNICTVLFQVKRIELMFKIKRIDLSLLSRLMQLEVVRNLTMFERRQVLEQIL